MAAEAIIEGGRRGGLVCSCREEVRRNLEEMSALRYCTLGAVAAEKAQPSQTHSSVPNGFKGKQVLTPM